MRINQVFPLFGAIAGMTCVVVGAEKLKGCAVDTRCTQVNPVVRGRFLPARWWLRCGEWELVIPMSLWAVLVGYGQNL